MTTSCMDNPITHLFQRPEKVIGFSHSALRGLLELVLEHGVSGEDVFGRLQVLHWLVLLELLLNPRVVLHQSIEGGDEVLQVLVCIDVEVKVCR